MEKISEERRKEIIDKLTEVGATSPCPRCRNNEFSLVEGYFNQTIQTNIKGVVLGGRSLPTVVVVCTRCGYVAQYALGTLGLLPKKEAKDE